VLIGVTYGFDWIVYQGFIQPFVYPNDTMRFLIISASFTNPHARGGYNEG
jgi:hypothetical protein